MALTAKNVGFTLAIAVMAASAKVSAMSSNVNESHSYSESAKVERVKSLAGIKNGVNRVTMPNGDVCYIVIAQRGSGISCNFKGRKR